MSQGNVQNLPAAREKEMVYQMANGDEMRLTPSMVRKFLVQGKSDLVEDKEIFYYMHECKARKLNPFLRECWLIKFSGKENAQIVESIHHKRNKAMKHPACQGWEKGIIVKGTDGTIKKTNGLILPKETLIGGWFRATPKGWVVPYELELNLKPFIKKKFNGEITAFWKEEKQPSQIMKVAEGQGLSAVFGDTVGATYLQEEFPEDAAPIEMNDTDGSFEQKIDTSEFNALVMQHIDYPPDATLDRFITETAEANDISPDQLKVEAVKSFDGFWKSFEAWLEKNTPEPEKVKTEMSNEAADDIDEMLKENNEAYIQAVKQFGKDPATDEDVEKLVIIFQEITGQ